MIDLLHNCSCVIIALLCIVTVECAHSKKHKLRLLYVDICKFVMELFSKSFFKQHFCEALLELAAVSINNMSAICVCEYCASVY